MTVELQYLVPDMFGFNSFDDTELKDKLGNDLGSEEASKLMPLGEYKWHELTYFEEKPMPKIEPGPPSVPAPAVNLRGRNMTRLFSDASSPEFDGERAAKRLKRLFT